MSLTSEEKQQKLDELNAFIQQHKDDKGALMPVMQKAQELFGYLSLEIQSVIAEALNVSVAEVYGVATFYAQFSLEPKGAYVIGVCTGTACYVKGAQAVLEKVESELNIPTGKTTKDGKFTIQATRCLGCCGLAPVMTINEDVYGGLSRRISPAYWLNIKPNRL